MKLSDAAEMIKNILYASEIIVKLSDASGTILIDAWWDQDNPNDKNIRNVAIQDDLDNWRMRGVESQGLDQFND